MFSGGRGTEIEHWAKPKWVNKVISGLKPLVPYVH